MIYTVKKKRLFPSSGTGSMSQNYISFSMSLLELLGSAVSNHLLIIIVK